jgi:DNA-binding MarR family transcriptional regulator
MIVQRYTAIIMRRSPPAREPAVDYGTLAELRYHIRRFLRAREVAARAAGVEPQHYLLLLQIRGLEDDRPSTVGALAERLQLRHHTVVELLDRLAARGMVARRRAPVDRRRVVVELRAAGHAVLKRLALYSVEELRTEGPALVTTLTRLIGGARQPHAPAAGGPANGRGGHGTGDREEQRKRPARR